jgi:ribonuclease HI
MKVDIFFDGACKNVKGSVSEPYGCGIAVFFDGIYCEEHSHFFGGYGTSNIAEWEALYKASEIASTILKKNDKVRLDIFGDSQLVVNQFNGLWSINNEHFYKLFLDSHKILSKVDKVGVVIRWIPREENRKADELSKLGLQQIKQLNNEKNITEH